MSNPPEPRRPILEELEEREWERTLAEFKPRRWWTGVELIVAGAITEALVFLGYLGFAANFVPTRSSIGNVAFAGVLLSAASLAGVCMLLAGILRWAIQPLVEKQDST